MQRSTHRLKLSEIGPHVKCVLCLGYLIDATTIVECLHSFCRSCLLLYLKSNTFCPICDVQIHKTNPLLSIKPDKTLQDIVYKLVPGLFRSEMRRRRLFYAKHPIKCRQASPEERGVGVERVIYSPDDSFSLSLEYYDLEKEREERDSLSSQSSESGTVDSASNTEASSSLLKRYLQCPALVTIAIIKKFIRMKFDLQPVHRVEVFHRHVSLANEYTLLDVAYIYTWKGSAPMRFFFRISEVPESTVLELMPQEEFPISPIQPTNLKTEKQHSPIASVKLLEVQQSPHTNSVQRSFASISDTQPTLSSPSGSSQELANTLLRGQTEQVQMSTSAPIVETLQLEQLSKKSIVKLTKLSTKSRDPKTHAKNNVPALSSVKVDDRLPSILLGQLSKIPGKLQELSHPEPLSNPPVLQATPGQTNKTSGIVSAENPDPKLNHEHLSTTSKLPNPSQQDPANNVLLKKEIESSASIPGPSNTLTVRSSTSIYSVTEVNHVTAKLQNNEVTPLQCGLLQSQDSTAVAHSTTVSKPKGSLNKLGLGLVIPNQVNSLNESASSSASDTKCVPAESSHQVSEVKPSTSSSSAQCSTSSTNPKEEPATCVPSAEDFKSATLSALQRRKKMTNMQSKVLPPSTSNQLAKNPTENAPDPIKPTAVKKNPNQQILTKNEEIIKAPMAKRSVYVNEALKRKLQGPHNAGDVLSKTSLGQKKGRVAQRPAVAATLKRPGTKPAEPAALVKKVRLDETSSSGIEVKREMHQEEKAESDVKNAVKKATLKKENVESSSNSTILMQTVQANPSTLETLSIKTELSMPHSKPVYNNQPNVENPLLLKQPQLKTEGTTIKVGSHKETSSGVSKNNISPNHKISCNASVKSSKKPSASSVYSSCHPVYSQQHVPKNKKLDGEKVTSPIPQLLEIPKPGSKKSDSGLQVTKQEIRQDPKQDLIGALDLTARPQSKSQSINYPSPSTTKHFPGSPPVSPSSSSRLIPSQLKIPNLSRLPLKPASSGATTPQLNRGINPQVKLRRIGTPISDFQNRKNVPPQPSSSEVVTRAVVEEPNASRMLSLGDYRSAMLPPTMRGSKEPHETPSTSHAPSDSAAMRQRLEMQARMWGAGARPDWFQDAEYVKRMETFMKSLGEMPSTSSFSNSKKCNR